MKKLVLVAAMLLLSVMAFGAIGTGAWFTDTAQIPNVTISAAGAGSLVINAAAFGPVGASALEPGGTAVDMGTIDVSNGGTMDMKFRGWFGEVVDASGLATYLRVTVIQNPTAHPGTVGAVNTTLCTAVPFNDLTVQGNACLTEDTFAVPAGQTVSYQFLVALDGTAPNSVQGASVVANIDYYATQFINPGW